MNKVYALISMLFSIVLAGCLTTPPASVKEPALEGFTQKFAVESLRFYTGNEPGVEKAYRVYNSSFRSDAVDLIWYELIVRNTVEKVSKILYREVWLDGDNKVISSVTKEMNLNPADSYLEYTAGIRADWKKGYYVLKIYQDSLEVAGREFKIID
ncbi:TPA: hypothetical protein DCR49_11465 [Candidatus Delongbacteria bacterium]|nr:MAG: hypothetical protein A2Y39_01470 [Candidatus Delongbacteria bacterium GWF2_40_14]HAQ62591.1 hypothetical protein [Candidatus Delongbacteria bacterium]